MKKFNLEYWHRDGDDKIDSYFTTEAENIFDALYNLYIAILPYRTIRPTAIFSGTDKKNWADTFYQVTRDRNLFTELARIKNQTNK